MVKDAKVGNVTAAIGDGGNDISMIQEAHVGLGIIGLEGNAAAKAADFAFTKVDTIKGAYFKTLMLLNNFLNFNLFG